MKYLDYYKELPEDVKEIIHFLIEYEKIILSIQKDFEIIRISEILFQYYDQPPQMQKFIIKISRYIKQFKEKRQLKLNNNLDPVLKTPEFQELLIGIIKYIIQCANENKNIRRPLLKRIGINKQDLKYLQAEQHIKHIHWKDSEQNLKYLIKTLIELEYIECSLNQALGHFNIFFKGKINYPGESKVILDKIIFLKEQKDILNLFELLENANLLYSTKDHTKKEPQNNSEFRNRIIKHFYNQKINDYYDDNILKASYKNKGNFEFNNNIQDVINHFL